MSGLLATEPVRVYLYGLVVAILAVLVGYGVIDGHIAPLWLAVAVAVLGVPTVEAARAHVYSPATVDRIRAGDELVG